MCTKCAYGKNSHLDLFSTLKRVLLGRDKGLFLTQLDVAISGDKEDC